MRLDTPARRPATLQARFRRPRAVSAILAVLLLAGWVHVASPPAAAGPRCEVSDTGVEVGCSTGGSGSGGSGGGTGGATRVCTTAFGRVVACTTALGTWTGDCYARPANPQPPFTDPIWGGRTDGTVLVCTVAGNGTYFAQRYYWVPDATVPDPAALAREAVAGLALAPPPLAMTPPPNLAEPNILINRPAFFTFSDASTTTMGPITATAADGSLRVSVTARLATITIDTGDGTTIACSPPR